MFLILLFLANFTYAQDFIISEIFTNPIGRNRTHGYQWIELNSNTYKNKLINNIHIAISTGRKNNIIFNKKFDLKENVFFDDYLIIAQDKFLGFDKALKIPIIEIKDPDFIIPNNKKFNICISINKDPFVCVSLSSKDKFEDGASLYYKDNLWHKENCKWQKDTYATPGLAAGICTTDPNFTDKIFDECSVKIFPINYLNKFHDVWSVRYCRINKDIKNLCEKITKPDSNISYRIEVTDLFGLRDKRSFFIDDKENNIDTPIITINNNTIILTAKDYHVPFNYLITNSQKETLLLGSVVKGGIKELSLMSDMSQIKIYLSGIFGEVEKKI